MATADAFCLPPLSISPEAALPRSLPMFEGHWLFDHSDWHLLRGFVYKTGLAMEDEKSRSSPLTHLCLWVPSRASVL